MELPMNRALCHRLRVEPLEERWLPAASVAPVRPPAPEVSSVASTQAETKQDESEYANGMDDDEQDATRGTTTSAAKSDEYKLTQNARFENPYFFNNHYYAVVAIPPPPAPVLPTGGAVGTSAIESRTVSGPADQVSSPIPDEHSAVVPTSAAADSHPLTGVPESIPEMPADPPPVDEQEIPTTPPADESTPQPGPTPASLLDDLPISLSVAEWEHAAKQLLDGLDRVLIDATDLDSPIVRLGYWIGTAAAVGVAIELTRHGVRARRPNLDLRLSARLPVIR
jgi:hypothetical protein